MDTNGGGGDKKVYLLVFSCLGVRAIHIELLQDMLHFAIFFFS